MQMTDELIFHLYNACLFVKDQRKIVETKERDLHSQWTWLNSLKVNLETILH